MGAVVRNTHKLQVRELDPQVALSDGTGRRWHSVNNYLDAYKEHSIELKKDPTNVVAQLMLDKINPATLKLFQATQTRAQRIAEDHLKLGMFKENKWPSHGQMISWQDAQAPDLGLVVEYLESDCEEWQLYWQLYCLQRIAIGDDCKLFESNFASLLVPG